MYPERKELYHEYVQTDYFKLHTKSFQEWLVDRAAQ